MLKSASTNDFVFYSTFCHFLIEIISYDRIISWDNVMVKRTFMELSTVSYIQYTHGKWDLLLL